MNSRIVLVVSLLLMPGGAFAQDGAPGAEQDQAARSWAARHPIITGALVGAGAGTGAGAVMFKDSDWPGQNAGVLIGAGMYAGIGTLVGFAVGRSVQPLKQGDTVRVRMADGSTRTGRFLSLDADKLSLEEERGSSSIDLRSVSTISRRGDSLKNGMLLGLLGGAGLGGVAGAVSHTKTGEVQTLEGVVAGATYGLVIGLLADALHKGWTTSYRAPRGMSMTIVPYAAPRQAGVTARIAFGR